MTDIITNPSAELAPKRRKRGVLGFIGAAVLVTGLGAASAAVFTINEVESEFALSNCLVKVAGTDATTFLGADGLGGEGGYYINFDATATEVDPATGVVTLQEKLDVVMPAGFRTQATDVFRVEATNCGTNFDISLKADEVQNTLGENTIDGIWSDKGVEMHLNNDALTGSADPVVGDFVNGDWNAAPLLVSAGQLPGEAADNGLTAPGTILYDNHQTAVGFDFISDAGAATSTLDGGVTSGVFRFQVVLTPTGETSLPGA